MQSFWDEFLGLTSTKQMGLSRLAQGHNTAPQDRIRALAIKSPTLSQLSYQCIRCQKANLCAKQIGHFLRNDAFIIGSNNAMWFMSYEHFLRTDGCTPAGRAILLRLKTHAIQTRLRVLAGIYLNNIYRLGLFKN